MDLMFAPLKKYADFQGRARRSEYWLFTLLIFIVYVVFLIVAGIAGGMSSDPSQVNPFASVIFLLFGVIMLGLFIPSLAVTVRRLHDTDRSGFWIFISFLPFVGGIWLFVLTVLDGTPGTNKFGPDPKGRGDSDVARTFA